MESYGKIKPFPWHSNNTRHLIPFVQEKFLKGHPCRLLKSKVIDAKRLCSLLRPIELEYTVTKSERLCSSNLTLLWKLVVNIFAFGFSSYIDHSQEKILNFILYSVILNRTAILNSNTDYSHNLKTYRLSLRTSLDRLVPYWIEFESQPTIILSFNYFTSISNQ